MKRINSENLTVYLAIAGTFLCVLISVIISLYATALDNAECAQIEAGNVQDFRTEPWEGGESIDSTRKTTGHAMDLEICA